MIPPDFQQAVEALRRETYCLGGEGPPIASPDDAVCFVQTVGFCLLFPTDRVELPALAPAAAATRADLWRWKDALLDERQLYVGKIFRRRPAFVSRDLLPALYALSGIALLDGDRLELYRQRYISPEVNRIAGMLAAKGPLTTRDLRRSTGFAAPSQRGAFRRTLADAEAKFLAARAGTTRGQRPYIYRWDTFARVWPEVVVRSKRLSTEQAGRQVVVRAVETLHAARQPDLARLFGLDSRFVAYIAHRLVEEGRLGSVSHGGQPYLISPALQERIG